MHLQPGDIEEVDHSVEHLIGVHLSPVGMKKSSASHVNTEMEMPSSPKKEPKNAPTVGVYINDGDDLGDSRITPFALKRLLQARPDLAVLLYQCVMEEGLDRMDEEDI